MSVLDRYKKSGGFNQILSLIETCGTAKKEKFLTMILEENPHWHDALKSRILTLEKILNWPVEHLSEVTSRSMPITLAAISKSLSEEQTKKFFQGLSHSQFAKIREISDNKNFTNVEISSSIEKFLGETRTHIQQGVVKLDKFAPALAVPDDIEDQLHKQTVLGGMPSLPPAEVFSEKAIPKNSNGSQNPAPPNTSGEELNFLKRQNLQLHQELQTLRLENNSMREKLEKIRKIA